MIAELLDPPMAKKRGRPATGRNDVTVRVDAFLASRAAVIAKDEGIPVAEYLSRIIAPTIERDLKKLGTKLLKPEDGKK